MTEPITTTATQKRLQILGDEEVEDLYWPASLDAGRAG